MNAVVEACEPSAKYLSTLQPPLVQQFDLLANAPGGVAKLRELILTLAVRGKLVPQDQADEPSNHLLERLLAERSRSQQRRRSPAIASEHKDVELRDALPPSWRTSSLSAIAVKLTDGSHNPPRDAGSGIPMLSSQNVLEAGTIDFSSPTRYVSAEDFEQENARTQASPGDVLLTIVASLGRSAVIPPDAPAFVLQRSVAVIRTGLVPSFLAMYLRSPFARAYYDKHGKGTAQKGIYLGKLGELQVPIPPLTEQARIVTRVEELMRLCDALEAKGQLEAAQHAQLVQTLLGALTASTTPEELADNWQRVATHFDRLLDRPEAIDALEQTILQLAVRGLLVPQDPNDEPASELLKKIRAEKDRLIAEGKIKRDKPLPTIEEIPFTLSSGWTWTRLGVVGESFTYGSSQKASDDASAVPILRMGNIQGGKVLMGNLKYLKDLQDELPSLLLEKGDVLFNRTNSYELVGKTGIFPGDDRPVTFASYLIRIRFMEQFCSPEYANLYMNTSDCRANEIEPDLTQQTGQANYNGTKLRNIRFPLPPREEQSRIVARVRSLRGLCADLRQRLAARQAIQTHLAEALIAEVA